MGHLLKMIWLRRSANKWIVGEIAIFLLVLYPTCLVGLAPVAGWFALQKRTDKDVWKIVVIAHDIEERSAEYAQTIQKLYAALKGHELITDLAGMNTWNFKGKYRLSNSALDQFAESVTLTDGMKDLMQLEVVAGRWFTPQDSSIANVPRVDLPSTNSGDVVITRALAEIWGGIDQVVGKEITWNETRRVRIIGVIDAFHPPGEWSHQPEIVLHIAKPGQVLSRGINRLWVRGSRNTQIGDIKKTLKAVAPEWDFEMTPVWGELFKPVGRAWAMVGIGSGIVVFLLVMVGLGLVGIFWQKVLQRTREIGIRRAVGGAGRHIWRQFLGEFLALATIGIAVGLIAIVHIDLLKIPFPVNLFRSSFEAMAPGIVSVSLVLAIVIIYLLTFVCAWYPCRLATRVHPAEALYYE